MKRLFVAIPIYPEFELLNMISKMKNKFSHCKINWVNERNMHLTLKFMGEVDVSKLLSIKEKLNEALQSETTFTFNLKSIGSFGNSRDIKVIWAGIEECKKLIFLYQSIEEKLSEIGFEKENRKFSPHLTLGRVKYMADKNRFYGVQQVYKEKVIQTIEVNRIILFESILRQEGPIYKEMEIFSLT